MRDEHLCRVLTESLAQRWGLLQKQLVNVPWAERATDGRWEPSPRSMRTFILAGSGGWKEAGMWSVGQIRTVTRDRSSPGPQAPRLVLWGLGEGCAPSNRSPESRAPRGGRWQPPPRVPACALTPAGPPEAGVRAQRLQLAAVGGPRGVLRPPAALLQPLGVDDVPEVRADGGRQEHEAERPGQRRRAGQPAQGHPHRRARSSRLRLRRLEQGPGTRA